MSSPKQLLRLLNLPLSRCIVDYIVEIVIEVVNHGLGRPPTKRGRASTRNVFHIKFRHFVDTIIKRAEATVPMLLATIAYVARAKAVIAIAKPDWAYERVFLGSLVLACKYHNDRSLKSNHWSVASGLFSPRDVSRIEREMLDVLNYELRVEEHEFLAHESALLSAFNSPHLSRSRSTWWHDSACSSSEDDDESDEEQEVSTWSISDEELENNTPCSSSDDSLSPVTPTTPQILLFPTPPTASSPSAKPKRATYPLVPIPPTLRATLSC